MRKLLTVCLLAALLLYACTGTETTSVSEVPVAPTQTPVPPEESPLTGLKTGLLEPVSDPLLVSIARVAQLDDQSPDPARQDILVVDASTHPNLGADPTVVSFLAAGKTVIFLNLASEQKESALRPHSSLITRGASKAFAVRRTRDAFGRPELFLFEWPTGHEDTEGPYFQQELLRYLSKPSSVGAEDSAPGPGLIYATFNYSTTPTPLRFTTTYNGQVHYLNPQVNTLTSDFTFQLYLENDNQATGNRQWLVVRNNTRAVPYNATLGPAQIDARGWETNYTNDRPDVGWFQTYLSTNITPNSPGDFQWQKDEPKNADKQETVTDLMAFSLNFLSSNGAGVFNYRHSDTYTVSEWNVNNLGSGQVGTWSYTSNGPYVMNSPGDTTNWQNDNSYDGTGALVKPNSLSLEEFQPYSQVAWTTADGVEDRIQDFQATLVAVYANIFTEKVRYEYGVYGRYFPPQTQTVNHPVTFSLNMGDVVPVTISSITFNPNPAITTSTQNSLNVVGTLTLAKPAPLDTNVFLTSDSTENASVTPMVVVPQGQTTATFSVLVNNNGLNPNQSFTATITAFDGTFQQAPITIRYDN